MSARDVTSLKHRHDLCDRTNVVCYVFSSELWGCSRCFLPHQTQTFSSFLTGRRGPHAGGRETPEGRHRNKTNSDKERNMTVGSVPLHYSCCSSRDHVSSNCYTIQVTVKLLKDKPLSSWCCSLSSKAE